MTEFNDMSSASPAEKLKRLLRSLAAKDGRYFFDDGFPRMEELANDAQAALEVFTFLEKKTDSDDEDVVAMKCGNCQHWNSVYAAGGKHWQLCEATRLEENDIILQKEGALIYANAHDDSGLRAELSTGSEFYCKKFLPLP